MYFKKNLQGNLLARVLHKQLLLVYKALLYNMQRFFHYTRLYCAALNQWQIPYIRVTNATDTRNALTLYENADV